MLTLSVLPFWITIVAIGIAGVSVVSLRCISCPCGSNGQNYSHCVQDVSDNQLSCETWADCRTCSANTTTCLSCSADRFGPTCSEVCGRIPPRTNRRRGSAPKAGDWPWTMAIAALSPEDAEDPFCGGVILDKSTVLTAAQCVTGSQNIILLFGTNYPTPIGDSGSEQKRRVFRVILHPDYNNETKANDIALLKFEPELNFSPTIQPVCLPAFSFTEKSLISGQKGVVPGWGYNYTLYMFIPAVKYEVANVSVQSEEKCIEACHNQGLPFCSTTKIFCADYPDGVDACMYRGVPMVIHDEEAERYTLAGLVTRKLTTNERNCRRGEINTVLTNVSNFLSFITENLS